MSSERKASTSSSSTAFPTSISWDTKIDDLFYDLIGQARGRYQLFDLFQQLKDQDKQSILKDAFKSALTNLETIYMADLDSLNAQSTGASTSTSSKLTWPNKKIGTLRQAIEKVLLKQKLSGEEKCLLNQADTRAKVYCIHMIKTSQKLKALRDKNGILNELALKDTQEEEFLNRLVDYQGKIPELVRDIQEKLTICIELDKSKKRSTDQKKSLTSRKSRLEDQKGKVSRALNDFKSVFNETVIAIQDKKEYRLASVLFYSESKPTSEERILSDVDIIIMLCHKDLGLSNRSVAGMLSNLIVNNSLGSSNAFTQDLYELTEMICRMQTLFLKIQECQKNDDYIDVGKSFKRDFIKAYEELIIKLYNVRSSDSLSISRKWLNGFVENYFSNYITHIGYPREDYTLALKLFVLTNNENFYLTDAALSNRSKFISKLIEGYFKDLTERRNKNSYLANDDVKLLMSLYRTLPGNSELRKKVKQQLDSIVNLYLGNLENPTKTNQAITPEELGLLKQLLSFYHDRKSIFTLFQLKQSSQEDKVMQLIRKVESTFSMRKYLSLQSTSQLSLSSSPQRSHHPLVSPRDVQNTESQKKYHPLVSPRKDKQSSRLTRSEGSVNRSKNQSILKP